MIQTQSNLALSYAQAGYLVNNQQFGAWNGTATSAGLVTQYGKTPNTARAVNIYRTDWQGRQLLYPTARTNLNPYSQFSGTVGALPTGWSQTGTGGGMACQANDGTLPVPLQYVQFRRPSGSGYQGMQLATNPSIPSASVVSMALMLRVPSGVTPCSLSLYTNQGVFLIASVTQLAAQTVGAWVRYTFNYTNTVTNPLFSLINNGSGLAGQGMDIAAVELEISNSAGVLITTNGSAVTLTDYTLSGTTVNLAQAPATTATTNATFYAT